MTKIIKIRKTWNRSPVQKPHSTKKGKKGYERSRDKKKIEHDIRKTIT